MLNLEDEKCTACQILILISVQRLLCLHYKSRDASEKQYFFRYEDHINCETDQMEYLSLLK